MLNWVTFGVVLSLGSMLMVGSIACYISAGAPAVLTWRGRARVSTVAMLSLALMCFGYCQHMFEMSVPLAVATGVVVDKSAWKHPKYEMRDDSGKLIELYPSGTSPLLDGRIAQVSYVAATGEIVTIQLRKRDGGFANSDYYNSRNRPNVWMWTGFLLLLLGWKPITVEELLMSMRGRGTIGDNFGRTKSQEDDMRWHFVGDRLVSKEEYLEHARRKFSDDE